LGSSSKQKWKLNSSIKIWIPEAFGLSELNTAFEDAVGYAPSREEFCHEKDDVLIYFTIDDLAEPRSVTFNCALIGFQSEIIKNITESLGAKIYDSEACCFVEV